MRDFLTPPPGAGASPEAPRQPRPLKPRSYKTVSVETNDDGFAVLLDAKPALTPGGQVLIAPSRPLAEALREEWAGQGAHIDPATMPLTRLVATARDGIAADPEKVAAAAAAYAASDLLCYRAEGPDSLVIRQIKLWDPILAFIERRFGLRFVLTQGVMPVAQEAAIVERVKDLLGEDPFRLAALSLITSLTGSVLIALALAERAITLEQALEAAEVDATWNEERWGTDAEAAERRLHRHYAIAAAVRLLALIARDEDLTA